MAKKTPPHGTGTSVNISQQEIQSIVVEMPTKLSQLTTDPENQTVTVIEKEKWNSGGGYSTLFMLMGA